MDHQMTKEQANKKEMKNLPRKNRTMKNQVRDNRTKNNQWNYFKGGFLSYFKL